MIHARSDYNRIQDPAGKIGEDEPVFLMRAQDDGFLPILRCAIEIYRAQGSNAVGNLERHVLLSEEWRGRHPTKVADLPPEVVVEAKE